MCRYCELPDEELLMEARYRQAGSLLARWLGTACCGQADKRLKRLFARPTETARAVSPTQAEWELLLSERNAALEREKRLHEKYNALLAARESPP